MNKPDILKKHFFCLAFGMAASLAFAEDWYISNSGGMALEPAFSRLALRSKYALSVENASLMDVPFRLLQYYNTTNRYQDPEDEEVEAPFRVELRSLYEEGELSRRQWSFRDEKNATRMVAVLNEDKSGFIEIFDAQGLITEARQLDRDGSEFIIRYFYNNSFLIRAVTSLFTPTPPIVEVEDLPADESSDAASTVPMSAASGPALDSQRGSVPESNTSKEQPYPGRSASLAKQVLGLVDSDIEAVPVPVSVTPPVASGGGDGDGTEDLWTDYYRYTRSYALRGVERRFHRTPPVLPEPDSAGEFLADERAPVLLKFPQLILGVGGENEFVQPGSAFSSEFFEDVIISSGDRIIYTTDERGRVISEIRRDGNDIVLGEVRNTWAGDRLASVLWIADAEERLIEYDYNQEGDRVFERNFRNGVLERTVRREGERDVEELYMNGTVILRALWEDGRKVLEERVRPASSRPRLPAPASAGEVRPESTAGEGE
ncbi:hypothetical protein TREPR_1769 [Treponema primitia ZAS-2]|uniref:Uncharacterized protein n=1 Tax=Treponema primitia (strain ATCC BAA-887 / DSM 12427 / ZAS-2) TaxID=545694 RepID=F5YM18_TREPZ|nr:hypothetical protein [Treponema primitia]AEF83615.1 hypothetical protein TREPR_1769 [Treponema primitia ZAS-2]